jgi:hypothetical protein
VPPSPTPTATPLPPSVVAYDATYASAPNSAAAATANCAHGTIVGGGFRISGSYPSAFYEFVPQPAGLSGFWQNYSVNAFDGAVEVVCVDHVSQAPIFAGAGLAVVPGAFGQATASCPTGSVATGGGFSILNGGSTNVTNFGIVWSHPTGSGWTVKIANFGTEALSLSATAYCYAGADAIVVQNQADMPSPTSVTVPAHCPEGRLVTGGGFLLEGPRPDSLQKVYDSTASTETGTWRVSARSISGGASVTAYAVCTRFPS